MIDAKWLNNLILLSGATQLHLPTKTLSSMNADSNKNESFFSKRQKKSSASISRWLKR